MAAQGICFEVRPQSHCFTITALQVGHGPARHSKLVSVLAEQTAKLGPQAWLADSAASIAAARSGNNRLLLCLADQQEWQHHVQDSPVWQRCTQKCVPHARGLPQVSAQVGVGSSHAEPWNFSCSSSNRTFRSEQLFGV